MLALPRRLTIGPTLSMAVMLLALGAVACASSGSAASSGGKYVAPTMNSRGFPQLSTLPPTSVSGRPTLRFDVEVMIDSTGKPLMDTYKFGGTLPMSDQQAVKDWIASAAFSPARRDGKPVAGLFKTTISAATRVERVR